MLYVDLRYGLPRRNYDYVVDLLVGLRDARDLVNSYFCLKKEVCCSIGGNEFAAGLEISVLVQAHEDQRKSLEEALYLYFSHAGVPGYVANYSDFDACDRALVPFQKKLRRRIRGGLFGKTVVDM